MKANIVRKNEDYKYSSYKDYIENNGVTQTKIMMETFGSSCNYLQIFKEKCGIRFMDIDNNEKNVDKYIFYGIEKYTKKESKEIYEILSDRKELKKIIQFLNEQYKIKYTEIREFFEIPRGTMDRLKG